jgi:hypothetical protein
MADAKLNREADQVQLPRGVNPRALVRWGTLMRLLKPVLKALHISAENMDVQELGDGGVHLKAKGGDGEGVQNFIVTAFSDGVGGYSFTVTPGTFMGEPVTLGGVELSLASPPVGTLGTGEKRVYIKATFSVTTTDDYVNAGELTSSIIEVKSAAEVDPLGPRGPGETIDFYIQLAWFIDGVKQSQDISTSLGGELCGVANDTGTANLEVFRS